MFGILIVSHCSGLSKLELSSSSSCPSPLSNSTTVLLSNNDPLLKMCMNLYLQDFFIYQSIFFFLGWKDLHSIYKGRRKNLIYSSRNYIYIYFIISFFFHSRALGSISRIAELNLKPKFFFPFDFTSYFPFWSWFFLLKGGKVWSFLPLLENQTLVFWLFSLNFVYLFVFVVVCFMFLHIIPVSFSEYAHIIQILEKETQCSNCFFLQFFVLFCW